MFKESQTTSRLQHAILQSSITLSLRLNLGTWRKVMASNTKSGRITLRVRPEVHQRLADIAHDLYLDINGLLNLVIRRSLD